MGFVDLAKTLYIFRLLGFLTFALVGGGILLYYGFRNASSDKGLSAGAGLLLLLIAVPLLLIIFLLKNSIRK